MGLKTEGVIAGAKAAVVAGLAAAVPTVCSYRADNNPFLKKIKILHLYVPKKKLIEVVNYLI